MITRKAEASNDDAEKGDRFVRFHWNSSSLRTWIFCACETDQIDRFGYRMVNDIKKKLYRSAFSKQCLWSPIDKLSSFPDNENFHTHDFFSKIVKHCQHCQQKNCTHTKWQLQQPMKKLILQQMNNGDERNATWRFECIFGKWMGSIHLLKWDTVYQFWSSTACITEFYYMQIFCPITYLWALISLQMFQALDS